ncbi:uncharacterized protein LOC131661651 [Vicia villosa]|uniref:uncharacterized protein LOC131661651 n=1 Tax=Vicia villosa TaxID=3911 RepID=UPI00273B1045|nr:uncharacterized protein LOC131661651 [Vicia villosa]
MAPFKALYGRRCRTLLCWHESAKSVVLEPEIVRETTEKVKLIREKMKTSQSRQKSYHDKRRKDLEFQACDHVFFRVTPVTGVGRALKSKKLTPRFIGPYQISEKVGNVAYRVALPSNLSNLHDIEDRETKTLRGKEIALVKVAWSGATGEILTWELERKMRESYPELSA